MEIISTTTPKARKEHICDWCNQKIQIGHIYNNLFLKGDDVYVWKNHIYCLEIANKLNMFDNCDEGLTESDFVEHISEEYIKIISQTQKDIYESKEFKRPSFSDQLDFVLNYYKINK